MTDLELEYDYDRKLIVYDSGNIDEVKYSISLKHLIVRFNTAAEYIYYNVPAQVFGYIVCSDSVGKTLRELVTDFPDIYKYERID
jgi:hypothetical protein